MSRKPPAWFRGQGQGEDFPPGSPCPGQVFHVHTSILGRRDAHPDAYRPAVVMAVSEAVQKVFVITRTTQPVSNGVHHSAVPEVGLNRDGVFDPGWYQSIDLVMFAPPLVKYALDLTEHEPDVWQAVLRLWEES